MADKEFKTIAEQITILKSRGLQIPNEALACDFLHRNNYYRVSGYSLTLRNHDEFAPSATFQNIIDIYEFDYNLRHILLKYMGIRKAPAHMNRCFEFFNFIYLQV